VLRAGLRHFGGTSDKKPVRLVNTRTVGDEPRLSDSKARPRRIDTDASTTASDGPFKQLDGAV